MPAPFVQYVRALFLVAFAVGELNGQDAVAFVEAPHTDVLLKRVRADGSSVRVRTMPAAVAMP